MTCCYACYFILNYLKVVEAGGGDDLGPRGAGIFDDGSGYGFVGVDENFFFLGP